MGGWELDEKKVVVFSSPKWLMLVALLCGFSSALDVVLAPLYCQIVPVYT